MKITQLAQFVMQSKGGVGKSVVSAILAQYFQEKTKDLMLIDTDPSNKTLGSYKGLDVEKVEVLNEHQIVDQSKFDGFINKFMSEEKSMLVDTGSGDFLPINSYLLQNELPELLSENGKQLIIHCPVNYGQAREDTFGCLLDIIENYPNTPIVVWQNEFFGKFDEDFKNTVLIKKTKNIIGVIKIRKMLSDTEEEDFSNMLEDSLTFKEVAEITDNPNYYWVQQTRLNRIKKEIWSQLDDLFSIMVSDKDVIEAEPTTKAKNV